MDNILRRLNELFNVDFLKIQEPMDIRFPAFFTLKQLENITASFLVLALFFLPISSSGKSICLGIAVFSIALQLALIKDTRKKLWSFMTKPWVISGGLFFLFVLIGCLWGPGSHAQKTFVVEKYSKLLYFPILVLGFLKVKTREWGLWAYMSAMLFIAVLSILKASGCLPFLDINPDHMFRNHIMTSFMEAFAFYLALVFSRRNEGMLRYLFLTAAVIYSCQILWVNQSKTGYCAYFFFLIFYLLMDTSTRKWMFSAMFLSLGCLLLLYCFNEAFHTRLDALGMKAYHFYVAPNDSSLGLRLQFHQFATTLFSLHPWLGGGTGSFTANFMIYLPVPGWTWQNGLNAPPHPLLDPHGQYWFIAAEYGTLGLLLLGIFFASLYRDAFSLRKMRPVALGLLSFFLIGNLTDSLLFYSGSGYFFLLLMALCLGELWNTDEPKPNTSP